MPVRATDAATGLGAVADQLHLDELYKAAKLGNGDIKSKRHAQVEGDGHEDDYAGPELPPDFDREDVPDDQEGRFFGGGITRDTAGVLDFIDQHDKEEPAVINHYSFMKTFFH
jgi:beta-catenin-like protein 1